MSQMTVDEWLRWTTADAERRGLPALEPLLTSFAQSLKSLRAADFNQAPGAGLPESPDALRASGSERRASDFTCHPSDQQQTEADRPEPAWTIASLGAQLRRREITSLAITDRCLQRVADDDPRLNAFILVMADEARAEARMADAELARGVDRGPLHGLPISIKDLLDVRGTPTTAASRVREGHVAGHDATVVARLREAGAVLIGKTNLHEFAFGTTNEESAFGPSRNPHDVRRSPGGSSGGSAASVAAGMALASIGTDTGGSIRIPAAACGIVGFKPPFGELSTGGVVPLSASLDHVGPLARCVTDAWSIYRILAGDHRPGPLGSAHLPDLRLGVLREYFCELLDDDVRAQFDEALDRLRAAGAHFENAKIPHAADIPPVYMTIVFSDAAAYHASTLEAVPERYSDGVRLRLEVGRYLPAEDLSRALKGREILRREVDAALSGFDVLVLPTLTIPAPELGAQSVHIGSVTAPVRSLMLRNTQLFNVTGHPAISLPCGATGAGLPCGLQLVGMRSEALLQVAFACEQVLGTGS